MIVQREKVISAIRPADQAGVMLDAVGDLWTGGRAEMRKTAGNSMVFAGFPLEKVPPAWRMGIAPAFCAC